MTENNGPSKQKFKQNFFEQNKLVLLTLVIVLMIGGFVYFIDNAEKVFVKQATSGQAYSGKAAIGGGFTMTDQNGQIFTEANLKGSPTMMFFGFTHCPDVCPMTLTTISEVMETLPKSMRDRLKVVFVTVDPSRDTPAIMKEYLANFDTQYIGLSGTEEQLKDMSKKYLVYYAKNAESDPKHYLMDHSSYVYLFDDNAEYLTHFSHKMLPEAISAKVQQAL
jgi:protein SCO1/2